MFTSDPTCAVGDGNSQVTFVASSKAAEGVEISSGDEKDDNHSIASSSLSNSSTITAPLSPNSHASTTAPLSPYNEAASSEFHKKYRQENVLSSEQEVLQTDHIEIGSAHNTDEHTSQVCEESVTEIEKQQTESRLHFNRNFQTDQFTEDENIVFEPIKKKTRKQITRKMNLLVDGNHDEGRDNFEVNSSACVSDHLHERSSVKGQDESYEEQHEEKSYEGI